MSPYVGIIGFLSYYGSKILTTHLVRKGLVSQLPKEAKHGSTTSGANYLATESAGSNPLSRRSNEFDRMARPTTVFVGACKVATPP